MAQIGTKVWALMIILLIVGIAIGYPIGTYTAPPKVVEKTVQVPVEKTVEVPVEKTVEVPIYPLKGEIFIGHIMSELPENRIPATEIAEAEVNEYVKKLGLPITFKVLIEDTEGSAVKALEKLESLAARGVKVVTGLTWSSHVKACKGYADEHKILLLSDGSTAPALAIPDDWVFRIVCDDTIQGKAIARMLIDYGIKAIVLMQRADPWGDGLFGELEKWFTEWGGVIVERIRYDPAKTEFSGEIYTVAGKVREAIGKYGEGKVAFELLSFSDEIVAIQTPAKDYPELLKTPWFGSDGHALSTRLVQEAAELAAQCKHICTFMAPTESSRHKAFIDKFMAKTGLYPDIYTILLYDCIWILAKAILEAGSYNAEVIRRILPDVAAAYFGATGWCKLNEAGDRAATNYDIWAVVKEAGKIDWKKVGVYDLLTEKITWLVPI